MKDKCHVCGSKSLTKTKKRFPMADHIEEEYEERCVMCGRLLYGYSKPV